ncbi:membrane protein [Streptomyces ruber]|uniref:Membrane protein n=2 Tax=Streptomyces TaxID=1883 RepID=A0A918BF11_9ACTN|nr:cytochrome c oxidase assembly protein [Streptomyces ruber]GGQ62170.1 membrane protein [Streptomyces ruber]
MTVAAVLLACVLYTYAAGRLRRRGDAWARSREASWWLGGAVLVCAVEVPWGTWLPPFTAHTAAHLGAGMAAPLLVVLARPGTLVLRTAPVPVRRGLLSLTRTRPVRFLVLPPVAALFDIGGLWVLYRVPLPAGVHHSPLLYVHLFAAGTLFTFSVLALDPLRHRPGLPLRAGTLLAAAAAHAVLAKSLYAAGPPGTAYAAADLRLASQLMYYGGDVVEIALAVVVAYQWYRAEGRALRRAGRPGRRPVPVPVSVPVSGPPPRGPRPPAP